MMMTKIPPIVILLALVLVIGCTTGFGSTSDFGPHSERYHREVEAESIEVAESGDTIYQRRMAALIRRSRLVRTDSLAKLSVALTIGTVDARLKVREALLCETYVQLRTHGYAAFNRAVDRMSDSLERTGFDADATSERSLTLPGPPMSIGNQKCFVDANAIPELPDSLRALIYPTRFMTRKPPKP